MFVPLTKKSKMIENRVTRMSEVESRTLPRELNSISAQYIRAQYISANITTILFWILKSNFAWEQYDLSNFISSWQWCMHIAYPNLNWYIYLWYLINALICTSHAIHKFFYFRSRFLHRGKICYTFPNSAQGILWVGSHIQYHYQINISIIYHGSVLCRHNSLSWERS